MEFTFDGVPVGSGGNSEGKGSLRAIYTCGRVRSAARRPIGCAQPQPSLICFSVTETKLRPLLHIAATIGGEVPVWDAQRSFGDTDLLVSNVAMGRDLARTLGDGTCSLMRGHGCTVVGKSIREAVFTAYYLVANADVQLKAGCLGEVRFLTAGEIEKMKSRLTQGKLGPGFRSSLGILVPTRRREVRFLLADGRQEWLAQQQARRQYR